MEDKKIKRQNIYRVIMLVILSVTITFMITTMVMYNKFRNIYGLSLSSQNTNSGITEISLLEKTLDNFKAILEQKYIGDINEEKMIDGAIKGYIEGLGDPYTEYLTKDEMTETMEDINSEYIGIGVYVGNDTQNNTILIVGVMNESPALKSGMQAGDILYKIEDVEYKGDQLDEAIEKLKKEEGKTLKVTVIRDNQEIELKVTTEKITVQHVASQMLENNIAYIQMNSFDLGVAAKFKEEYTKLQEQGAKGIIIDIRSNGGGVVNEAVEIADYFLEKDKVILITKQKEDEEKETKATKNQTIKDVPVVVLVNQATASASEILAGALRDQYGATIVGKTSFGKGVIQTLYKLSNGAGLKITTEEYYTPNHNKINGTGITPDIDIELTVDEEGYYETEMDKDAQLLKAIETIKEKIK